eukprot:8854562-Karenia_brevis.AAC.1
MVASLANKHDVPYRWLLEEVATMAVPCRDRISHILQSQPLLLHSADFGHVHRALSLIHISEPTRH